MAKPTYEWTEDDILSLPRGENDTFERKGAPLLDLMLPQAKEGSVLDELAKQLSAFANTGGGRIVYGITNTGTVDNGGISRWAKGRQSTKEWLEDVIPNLTDFEIVGFNVYEILPKATGSALAPDKSLYVVDVPDSERAPHQSKRDLKYYVRLGGKSHPAPHRLIEDIRNRARHPKLEVHDLQIVKAVPQRTTSHGAELESQFHLCVTMRFGIRNIGRVRTTNACLQFSATVALSMNMLGDDYFLRQGLPGTVLLEIKNPLYPGMEVMLACPLKVDGQVQILSAGVSLTFGGLHPNDVLMTITTFADSAPAQKQEFKLIDIDPQKCLDRMVDEEVKHIRSSQKEYGAPQHRGPWS